MKTTLFLILIFVYVIVKSQECCSVNPLGAVGGPDPDPNTGFGLALGDIDGDGDADMAVHSAYENTYIYKFVNGSYQLSQTITYSSSDDSWQYGLNLVDIDNDGDLDLVTTPQWSSAKMFIYKNNGSGTFSVWQQLSVGISAYNKAMGDIDGDGDVDIVMAQTGGSTPLYVYKNNGNGVFSLYNTFAGEGGRTVVLADVDNDGDLDALVATQYYGTGIRLYRNDGNGNFVMDNQEIGSSNFSYSSVATGDFNGDGKVDIAAGTTNQELQIFKNLGNGYFTLVNTLIWEQGYVGYYMQLRVTDIDIDGRKDIVGGCYSGGVVVWKNKNNDFEFNPCYRSTLASYNHGLDVADINNDGKVDIVGTEANDAIAYVFLNNGQLIGTPASASNDGPVCEGLPVHLYANPSGANTYSWSGPDNYYGYGQNVTVNPTTIQSEGNYTVLVVNNLCYNKANTYVQIYPSPQVNAGNDVTTTQGSQVQLNATVTGGSGNYTIQWQPDSLLDNPFVLNPTTNSLSSSVYFILTVTDNVYGCSSSDTVYITIIGSTLSVQISANDTSVCMGNSVNLIALGSGGTGNYTYNWSSDPQGFSATGSNVTVTPSQNTTYYVTIDDGNNTAIDSINIVVLQPYPSTVWNDGPYCLYDNVILHSSDAQSYLWQGPDGFTSTEQNPIVGNLLPGNYVYQVTITDVNGCTTVHTNTVTVYDQPQAMGIILPDSLDLNYSDTATFYGINTGNIVSYTWIINNNSFNNQNVTYTFTQTGTYTIYLIVENSYGCTDTVSFIYTVYNTTMLSELNRENIKVYPNPTSSSITIKSNNLIQYIEITDIVGKIIDKKYVNNSECSLYLEYFTSGIYRLKIVSKDGKITQYSILKQ